MKARKDVIVTIAPTSRGFGFAIFAAPTSLVGLGREGNAARQKPAGEVKSRGDDTGDQTGAVVIENWLHESCRRSERVRALLCEIAVVAHKGGATAMVYSRQHIRQAFGELRENPRTRLQRPSPTTSRFEALATAKAAHLGERTPQHGDLRGGGACGDAFRRVASTGGATGRHRGAAATVWWLVCGQVDPVAPDGDILFFDLDADEATTGKLGGNASRAAPREGIEHHVVDG